MSAVLWFVVPCYNEQDALPVSAPVMLEKMKTLIAAGKISAESRILFVNDGSSDGTWDVVTALHEQEPMICGISLAHNAGEQNAHLAGMFTAAGYADAVITMDCDLQDDINAVDEMIDRFDEGYEIVCGVRSRREGDTLLKKLPAKLFYKLMTFMDVESIEEHEMYRLMSRRAVNMLSEYGEINMHLPTIVLQLGLKRTIVYHERFERVAGTTKYSLKKLVRFALNAVTAATAAPVALITLFAAVCMLVFIGTAAALICVSVKNGAFDIPLAILGSVWLIGAGLACSLRLLGEYICKNYQESKKRPRYHIAEAIGQPAEALSERK